MNGTQKKKIIDLLFKLPAVKESWILAMLSFLQFEAESK